MSSRRIRIVCASLLLGGLLALAGLAGAQTATPAAAPALSVAEFAFAVDYDHDAKAPVEVADTFGADVGMVVCFSRITGATQDTQITHVWYHEGEVRAKVELHIGSKNWRTYSTKNIQPSWTGAWEVRVLDEEGTLLHQASFTGE